MKLGALAVLVVISVAGCASPTAPTVTPIAEPSATHTPSSTEPSPAVPLFGGDCNNLITDEQVAAIFGPLVEAERTPPLRKPSLDALGGMECLWGSAPGFGLTAAPASVIDSTPPSALSCVGDGGFYCTVEAVASGYWFTASAWVGDGSDLNADLAAAQAALEIVFANAATAGPPAVRSTPAESWPPFDCETLSASADVPGVLADADLQVRESTTDVSMREQVLRASLGATACSWMSSTSFAGFTVELIPGGGWLVDEAAVIDGARAVTVDGATAAWIARPGGFESAELLFATDGVNLLTMLSSQTTTSVEAYLPVLAALIAAAP